MAGSVGIGATRIAAIATIAIVLTVGYAFLAGVGSIGPGQNSQGLIGNNGTQPRLVYATTATVTETATSVTQLLQTTTMTFSYTETNSQTTTTLLETTTLTYTNTETTTSSCTVGRCIMLVATTSTTINHGSKVSFRATDPIPSESHDAFTAFMDCGCNGGVAHGYFSNGIANFNVTFTLAGSHQIYVADGNEATNASTVVFSNSVFVTVN